MTKGVASIMWKEWRSLVRFPGGKWRLAFTVVAPVAFFAFYGPASAGPDWVERADAMFIAVVMPLVVAMMVAPDAFAGERERRTLATLLAGPLPDLAILTGKALFAIAIAWAMGLLTIVVALVIVNLMNFGEGVLMLTPLLSVASVVISLLVAILTVGVGIIVSLRAGTVQQAQQLVAAFLLMPAVLLGPALFLVPPDSLDFIRRFFEARQAGEILGFVVAILIVSDLVLGWLAVRRLRRDRLVLNLPS